MRQDAAHETGAATGRLRRLCARTGALLAVATATGMAVATPSLAGTYRVYSCRIPSGPKAGAPAPLETVEGNTETPGAWDRVSSGVVEYGNTCSLGGSLTAALEAGVPHSAGDVMTWEFTAPTGESIVNASLWRAGDVSGGDGYVFWLAAQANPSYAELVTSETTFGGCAFLAACSGFGDASAPLGASNQYAAPSSELSSAHLYINVGCSRTKCAEGLGDNEGYAAIYRVYATEMELEERSGPTVTNVSGELAEAGTLSGEAGLQFDAEDPGSG
ncbi:MAG: hypothetical protein ACYCU0_10175, partial [Solirubrobacteraceae bacterium]